MKDKQLNIVLGDKRIEFGWGPRADGPQVYYSNFAPDAHDYTFKLP